MEFSPSVSVNTEAGDTSEKTMGPCIFQATTLTHSLLNKGEKTDGKDKSKGGVLP